MAKLDFPVATVDGQVWTGTNGVIYTYVGTPPNGYWQGITGDYAQGSNANIHVGDTPPLDPEPGNLWWDSSNDSGRLYMFYEDIDSSQWVEASPSGTGEDAEDGEPTLWDKNGNDLEPKVATDNVVIGGDKITLNANGSISAKSVEGGENLAAAADGYGFICSSNSTTRQGNIVVGSMNADQSVFSGFQGATRTSSWKSDGTMRLGGTIPSAPNITLDATDGSINAKTIVKVGTTGSSAGTQGGYLWAGDAGNNYGQLVLYSNSETASVIQVVSAPDSSTTKTVRSRFLGDGKLQIGTDLKSLATTNIELSAAGTGTFANGIQVAAATAAGTGAIVSRVGQIDIRRDGALGPCYSIFSGGAGVGSLVFKVENNGTISAKNTVIQQLTSERRLKENIVAIDADTAWETIKSTPYYTYNFIGNETTSYGPMADEVPTEMVVQTMEENEEGVMVARSDDEGPIRTYDNGMLQARLYTALQTALTRIEALETAKASLEARLTALEGAN